MSSLFSNNPRKPRVMGILNVTPDSFSDGGQYHHIDQALTRAEEILHEGASMLDVGAESSRPGAAHVSVEEERSRLSDILRELQLRRYPLPISLDTYKPEVAAWALEKGYVQVINDIQGLRNPEMEQVVRIHRAPVILMHMYETPDRMQQTFHYENIVEELKVYFSSRLERLEGSVELMIDPGIGFGKSLEHNLTLIQRADVFVSLGVPVLYGTSRKSFIGTLLGRESHERLVGSVVSAACAVQKGASWIRAHDVRAHVDALKMLEAIAHVGT